VIVRAAALILAVISGTPVLALDQVPSAAGQEYRPATVENPAGFDPFRIAWRLPGDVVDFVSSAFSESIPGWVGMAAGTGLLVAVDGPLYDKSVVFGNSVGIPQENKVTAHGNFRIPLVNTEASVIELPANLGGAMYFLGNGWFYAAITAGFLGYGVVDSDSRAVKTASDIVESMVGTGLVILTLKMSTGRENPNTRETPSGRWRLFRNPPTYMGQVNKYDAFPSGHLATAMSTLTVICYHYPDTWWIRPLGYSLMTVLGYQMVNSGVHWYSDYPLGIYIGYTFANNVTGKRGKHGDMKAGIVPRVDPVVLGAGMGLQLRWRI
jgi:membrane-associated phospholipid phosphatase